MTEFDEKIRDAFDKVVDDYCEFYGVIWTIQWLLDQDFTKEDLIAMRFDEADIDTAIEIDSKDEF